jgi:hypothetical protein
VLRRFDRRGLFVGNGSCQFRHIKLMQIFHSITFGTRNRPRSTAGALF